MMSSILFFDTETNKFPHWKIPSEHPDQPHMVQLAALLVDEKTREITQSIDLIIQPSGWEIAQESLNIHGITEEKASAIGVPEDLAAELFIALAGDAKRVSHNRTFDQRIIRIAMKRYDYSDDAIEKWGKKGDSYECTMLMSKKFTESSKLEDVYRHFTGKDLENAHTAMADARACMDIYFAMKDADS